MDAPAVAVAVLFGALMGWGLGKTNPDPRPIMAALAFAFVLGVVLAVADLGPAMARWSLIIASAAAVVGLIPARRSNA